MRIVRPTVLIIPLCLCACSTFENGAADEVAVVTDPPGASIKTSVGTTSSGPNCLTPCKVYVERREEFTVTVSKPGFVALEVEVKSRLAGSGEGASKTAAASHDDTFVIDNLTGATLEHYPNPVIVKLDPE